MKRHSPYRCDQAVKNTELMSGSGPDLIIMDGLSVEKYADMGLLLPLDVKCRMTSILKILQKLTERWNIICNSNGFPALCGAGADRSGF